ncbi:hydrogenase maturation protease [Chitinilyticum aquatile]|uniref:hydrogenase maturation protease n=1 Tax=Chitinilyticum aquatile TaxID=362520 RepID=UPI00040BFA15|nr:hydrogenase maturation protease [Chitinilyticum aquatile]
MTRPAPILFFGYGNPSRGDDALGPLLGERLAAWVAKHELGERIDILTDFQLSPEHAFDLAGRELVIFADASRKADSPASWHSVAARQPTAWASHASSPAEVLWHCQTHVGTPPQAVYLLELQGNTFELDQPLSATGQDALAAGWELLQNRLHQALSLAHAP